MVCKGRLGMVWGRSESCNEFLFLLVLGREGGSKGGYRCLAREWGVTQSMLGKFWGNIGSVSLSTAEGVWVGSGVSGSREV